MHVCENCLKVVGHAENFLKWTKGCCGKCLKWGWVAVVGLSLVLEHDPHVPESNVIQQRTAESVTAVSSGGTTTPTTPDPHRMVWPPGGLSS